MSTLKLKQHATSRPGKNGGGYMFSFLPIVLIPSKSSSGCFEECKDVRIAAVMCCGPVSINPRLLSCILTVTYVFLPNLYHILLTCLLHYTTYPFQLHPILILPSIPYSLSPLYHYTSHLSLIFCF